MRKYSIAVVPGDGVGPEVVTAARRVLDQAVSQAGGFQLAYTEYPAGKQAYETGGQALPPATLAGMRQADATLLGALAAELVPSPSPTGQLRKALDLFADVRPVKALRGAWAQKPDIDIVCIRENNQGFLADRNLYKGYGEFMPTDDVVMSVRVLSRRNCEQIARYAFAFARSHNRKKITVAHKANVLQMGCTFFLDIVREVAKEFNDIELDTEYVDSVANHLISAPDKYDILLTTNLFGDILSDEAAALVSNLVPTANIGHEAAVFRPMHEACLKEAGHNVINPLSAILSGAMLLSYLGETGAAQMIETAVEAVLSEGAVRPKDMAGTGTTTEVTAAVCDKVRILGGS